MAELGDFVKVATYSIEDHEFDKLVRDTLGKFIPGLADYEVCAYQEYDRDSINAVYTSVLTPALAAEMQQDFVINRKFHYNINEIASLAKFYGYIPAEIIEFQITTN